jgi:TonB family protein
MQTSHLRKASFIANFSFSVFSISILLFTLFFPFVKTEESICYDCGLFPRMTDLVKIKYPPRPIAHTDLKKGKNISIYFRPLKVVKDFPEEETFFDRYDNKTTQCTDKNEPVFWNERWLAGEFQSKDSLVDSPSKQPFPPPPPILEPPREQGEICYGSVSYLSPEFPGGNKALIAYLETHIKRPEHGAALEGRVIVSFTIAKDGSIQNVKIVHALAPDYDAIVLKVVAEMPPWSSARSCGRPVPYNYSLPVDFTVE